jgi:hypothetical protein
MRSGVGYIGVQRDEDEEFRGNVTKLSSHKSAGDHNPPLRAMPTHFGFKARPTGNRSVHHEDRVRVGQLNGLLRKVRINLKRANLTTLQGTRPRDQNSAIALRHHTELRLSRRRDRGLRDGNRRWISF